MDKFLFFLKRCLVIFLANFLPSKEARRALRKKFALYELVYNNSVDSYLPASVLKQINSRDNDKF